MSEATRSGGAREETIRAFEAHVERMRRRLVRRRIVMGLAVGSLSLWGFWLQGQARGIDAEGAAFLARQKVESMLPEAQRTLERTLAQEAPALVDRGLAMARQLPYRVRQRIQPAILAFVDEQGREARRVLDSRLDLDVAAARRTLRREAPGLGEEERLVLLAERTLRSLRESLTAFVGEHAGAYAERMRELQDEIDGLGDARGLTRKGRIQRRLLRITLELLARGRESGESFLPEIPASDPPISVAAASP